MNKVSSQVNRNDEGNEERKTDMTQNKPHPWSKEIIAWAQGITIQRRNVGENEWYDCVNSSTNTPYFGKSKTEFRIKPSIVKYRLALMRGGLSHEAEDYLWVACAADSDRAKFLITKPSFIAWLGDWVEEDVTQKLRVHDLLDMGGFE